MKPLHVGLVGFGTVGRGTWDVLRRNEEEIVRRAGRPIRITWIGTRTLDRARAGTRGITGVQFTDDPYHVTRQPDVDIVCELIGGIEPSRSLILDAIAHGKHIVTAYKALLAQAKVSVSPGIGFGEFGDGHVRFAMIENEPRTRQAIRGIKQMFREDGLL